MRNQKGEGGFLAAMAKKSTGLAVFVLFLLAAKWVIKLALKLRTTIMWAVWAVIAFGMASGMDTVLAVIFSIVAFFAPLAGVIAAAIFVPNAGLKKFATRCIPVWGDIHRITESSKENKRAEAAMRFLLDAGVISENHQGHIPAHLDVTDEATVLTINGVVPGTSVEQIIAKAEKFRNVFNAEYLKAEPLMDGGVRLFFYYRDPNPGATEAQLRATNFLVQSGLVSKTDVENGYRPPATMFEHNGNTILVVEPMTGKSTDDIYRASDRFRNLFNAKRVQSDDMGGGITRITFFSNDPLDAPQLRNAPGALDEKTMKVECAVDSNGQNMSIEFGGSSGMIVGGVPGSGKTAGVTSFLLPLALSPAVNLTVINAKVGEDWENYEGAASAYIATDDLEPIRDLLKEKYDEMLSHLEGLKQRIGTSNFWNASVSDRARAGMKMELVVIDECQEIFERAGRSRDEQKLMDEIDRYAKALVKRGRSAGFFTLFITQKPTAESIPSAIRDNCGLRVSFHVKTAMAAEAILGSMMDPTAPSPTDIPYPRKGGAVMADDAGNMKAVRFFYVPEDVQERLLPAAAVVPVQTASVTSVSAEAADGDWGWS